MNRLYHPLETCTPFTMGILLGVGILVIVLPAGIALHETALIYVGILLFFPANLVLAIVEQEFSLQHKFGFRSTETEQINFVLRIFNPIAILLAPRFSEQTPLY